MNTVYKMAQDLSLLAYNTDNSALRAIVDRFLDADDAYVDNPTPKTKSAAMIAHKKMRSAWLFHNS
ncbi:MAG: hypothetical protein ACYSUV_21060 [Planctomycetota bacterium]|jgi:hypothetical protein